MLQQEERKKKRSYPGGSSVITPLMYKQQQKIEKISKFFTKTQTEPTIDSPFKNTLSNIEPNVIQNEDNDFKTPELKKKVRPFQEQKVPKKRLRQKKISTLIRSVEENFMQENVNSEHLQMALALSKSVCDDDETDSSNEVYKAVYNSTQEKVAGVKRTLEEFGFKSERKRLPDVYQRTADNNKKRKKSKFRYITPILFTRTEEERQMIIANKVSLILSDKSEIKSENGRKSVAEVVVCSDYLKNLISEESSIIKLNYLIAEELTNEKFYIKELNFSPSCVKCGSQLKDWNLIPGRETTPTREVTTKTETVEQTENLVETESQESGIEIQRQKCVSPDLFESEDEINKSFENKIEDIISFDKKLANKISVDSGICEKMHENQTYVISDSGEKEKRLKISSGNTTSELTSKSSEQSTDDSFDLLSKDNHEVIASEKGILHYESFCKESEILSQEYVDLTQSSDDEENEKDSVNKQVVEDLFKFTSENTTEFKKVCKKDLCSNDEQSNEISFCTLRNNSIACSENQVQNETDHHNSFNMISFEETFRRESLNVTDYIHNILNQNEDTDDEVGILTKSSPIEQQTTAFSKQSSCDSIKSTCSQESIYISDEEINYSSIQEAINVETSSSDDSVTDDLDFTGSEEKNECIDTPKPGFVVRTTNVTPMPDYDRMDTPKVTNELKKFGVKAMKRKRGIQLLKYIYDATHPIVQENMQIAKKRKISDNTCDIEIVGDIINESELQDLIFEKKQSSKVHSCRLPLQIAFYNFLCCNPEIRKKILLYEPLQLKELHLMLKHQGFKYDIKDLLTFLDKKCITVRVKQK